MGRGIVVPIQKIYHFDIQIRKIYVGKLNFWEEGSVP